MVMSPELTSSESPDDEIELEPTTFGAAAPDASADLFRSEDLVAEDSPSFVSDLELLLRSRLLWVAAIAGTFNVVRLVFGLLNPESGEGLATAANLSRAVLSLSIAGLLYGRRPLSLVQLRIVEYVFFGLHAVAILVSQYLISAELMGRGDVAHLVAFEKNGVIRMLILMIAYGVLIPNDPRTTARVVLTMALGPIVFFTALLVYHADAAPALTQMPSAELAISNALFVLQGATVAIFAAYVLNALHRQVHDARSLGQYQLKEKLGEGGMGEVYLAEHHLLKRPCALKLVKPDVEDNSLALARFEREVQSAAMLSHPNTIEVYDYGRADDGTFYYVMEYLPGLSVADLVAQFGTLSPGRAVYLMRQVCKSLAEAHRLGMVHRDLKPGNIFVAILGGECDVAKVLDFGLVKVTADPSAPQLTAEYTVSGTPSFMAPEQATGNRDLDGRADIYALGAILYFMLTGTPPFIKDSPAALMIAHVSDPVVPPRQRRPEIPADLDQVVVRCLAKSPGDRYEDARALGAALAACQCAADWDAHRAEQWWIEQASSHLAQAEQIASATAGASN